MDVTIHASVLPHDDPDAALAFCRDTPGFDVRAGAGPPGQPGTSILLAPPATGPGITGDERRMIAEMMAKGARGWILPATGNFGAPSSGCRPATPRPSRSRSAGRTAYATAPSAVPRAA